MEGQQSYYDYNPIIPLKTNLNILEDDSELAFKLMKRR